MWAVLVETLSGFSRASREFSPLFVPSVETPDCGDDTCLPSSEVDRWVTIGDHLQDGILQEMAR